MPDALIHEMRGSPCLRLQASMETRVALLSDEYRHFFEDRALLDAQLDCLVGLHGREKIAAWKALAARGAWREFVTLLLTEHYDPAYRRSSLRNFAQLPQATPISIRAADDQTFDAAARELLEDALAA